MYKTARKFEKRGTRRKVDNREINRDKRDSKTVLMEGREREERATRQSAESVAHEKKIGDTGYC